MSMGSFHRQRGFTLLELIVTIATIAILATLSVSAYSKVWLVKNKVVCASNLRSIGSAITLFAQEQNGSLPGPVYTGQKAYYHDPAQAIYYRNLCDYLAPVMDLPPAQGGSELLARVFVCPGWKAWKGRNPSASDNVYIVPYQTRMEDGSLFTPFGYPGATVQNPQSLPMKLIQIPSLSKRAALMDADGGLAPGWAVPPAPVHGKKRNYLFFDGHVETLEKWP